MLLPRFIAAALALRQTITVLPDSYCQPDCPACFSNMVAFDPATSCEIASPFLTNCGACQSCIAIYAIQNGSLPRLSDFQNTLSAQISRCEKSNGSAQVSAIASQVARISSWGVTQVTATATITTAPAATQAPDSLISSTAVAQPEATASFTSTSSSSSETTQAGPGPELNHSWIAGPVIGSILGLSTVFVVIYCTRRKQRREDEWEFGNLAPKEVKEDDTESAGTNTTMPPLPVDDNGGKAQLHSECIPVREMDNTEVIPPAELPALEPVGQEMLSPRGEAGSDKEWPLPISPLPALFAMTEIRDERMGVGEEPRHKTFYNP